VGLPNIERREFSQSRAGYVTSRFLKNAPLPNPEARCDLWNLEKKQKKG
jgi:hypothetical protein